VLLAAEGLQPSSRGARLQFSRGWTNVLRGSSVASKDPIAGLWIFRANSMEEAIEWAERCPNPEGDDFEIEIRPVFEAVDFGPALAPELRKVEERVGAQMAENAKR
jgi:hypothetical protein